MIKGYAGRVLEIDLASKQYTFKPLDEETARLYIGGKGYGTRLLYDRTEAGIDPLGPENPLIFATGPLNGSVAPQSNRFAVVCKSPLTGGIGNATCGGDYAYGMKRAGLDVIVGQQALEHERRYGSRATAIATRWSSSMLTSFGASEPTRPRRSSARNRSTP